MNHDAKGIIQWLGCLCAILVAGASHGQSLAIARKGIAEFSVEGAVPATGPHRLQASANLRLWIDVQGELQGRVSHRVDSAGTTKRFFRLVPDAEPPPPLKIVLLGDSTVADLAVNNNVFNGWGQGMYGYFKPDAQVINLAVPGYSTKVFLTSAEKAQMLAIKPDYVLIGLCLLDEFGIERQKTSLTEYGDNLRTILGLVRDFGGTPILVTPPALRIFDTNNQVVPVYRERYAVMKNVAAATQTYLIDLDRISTEFFNTLGKSGSDYIWYADNYLHFSDTGAKVVAGLVVNALPEVLGPYLLGNVLDPPPGP